MRPIVLRKHRFVINLLCSFRHTCGYDTVRGSASVAGGTPSMLSTSPSRRKDSRLQDVRVNAPLKPHGRRDSLPHVEATQPRGPTFVVNKE